MRTHRTPIPIRRPAGTRCLWLVLGAMLMVARVAAAATCDNPEYLRLTAPVDVSTQERAILQTLAPLRVESADAPPMTLYDAKNTTYTGVAADILCFIADRLQIGYTLIPGRERTVADKIERVQDGRSDLFVPLSLTPERAQRGLFTAPFYNSYYAVIARKGSQLPIYSAADLARYRIGVIDEVSLIPILQSIVPPAQLQRYDQAVGDDSLFQAVSRGAIDVAVFNKSIFTEKRYRSELFDLEVIYTLHEYPRAYRFYFSDTPRHRMLVGLFDRYLAALDTAGSVAAHEDGESQFIGRYVAQRSQQQLLKAGGIAAVLLAILLFLGLRHYRRLTLQLTRSNQHILQQQAELREINERLSEQSLTDALTHLANRRHFNLALQQEYARARRTGTTLSLLMIDLDHFKRVNDLYGHAVGDDYLRAVARVLEDHAARPADLAARYGGEEFTCLLPATGAQGAYEVAEHIRQDVAGLALPNALSDPPILTISIGVASTEVPTADAQALLARADAQLYAAKRGGRNRTMLEPATNACTAPA